MASVTEYQQQQISKLEDKVENLINLVGNLNSTCELRHKTDLALQLTHVSKDVESLSKRLDDMGDDFEDNDKLHTELEKRLTELNARVNIIILKLDKIVFTDEKNKDNKTNFITQVVVIVLAAIIIAIIGFIWAHAWNSITQHNFQSAYNSQVITQQASGRTAVYSNTSGVNNTEKSLKSQ